MKNNTFFYKLNTLLTVKDKYMLLILFFMTILLSVIETIGISAIMPFISSASNPELIYENKYYMMFYDFFILTNSKDFIIYFGTILIIFYLSRGLYTIFYSYMLTKLSMGKYSDFANKLFTKYINMPYIMYIHKNSATLTKVIITEALQLSSILRNVLILFSEVLVITMLYLLLIYIDIKMTLILTFLLGIKVILLLMTISKRIKKEGENRAAIQDRFYRNINETLGNFKFIKFTSNQEKLINNFTNISKEFTKIQTINDTLQVIPRSVLEAVGLSILMGIIIYIVSFTDDVSSVIPIISMYALALYRILPAISKILNSYNSIVFYVSSLNIVYENLAIDYNKEYNKDIYFYSNIKISDLSFSYTQKEIIINNISLEIKKGQSIAFIGESGSGKSTLVDLICGIYRPDNGKIFIDGVELDNSNIVSWRKKIGYIPQSIYLFDGSIGENITFGRYYNEQKLTKVLKQANIYDIIMQKDGLDTMVGEGGVQLSGGQKQRIGIARALYGDPEILVLDEATSALDTDTETAIMEEIYKVSKDKTLMIIAHRLSTIEGCDIKIDVSKINECAKQS